MKRIVCRLYYVVIPILVIGISIGYTSFALALAALVPLLFVSTRHTIAVFLVMYGGPLCGVIRAMYPTMPIYGLIMEFLGFILMWDLVMDLFHNNLRALGEILLALTFFGLFFLVGPRTEFATTKYLTMCYHGLFMVFGYYTFERSSSIDAESLTRLLLVACVCMFAYLIHTIGMHVGGVFDYDWFREQFLNFAHLTDWEGTVINYQHVGMLASFATAIFLSQTKLKSSLVVFYLLCAIQLVLTAGARQGIFGVVIIIVLRFTFFKEALFRGKNQIGRVLRIILGLAVFLFALSIIIDKMQSDLISSTLQGETGRNELLIAGIAIFLDNPIFGTGIGGFEHIVNDGWPHNLIIELLCETGLVGFSISLLIIIISLFLKKRGVYHITASNQFYFLILTAIFVRVMVSSDLRESIELFSAVFAVTSAKSLLTNNNA